MNEKSDNVSVRYDLSTVLVRVRGQQSKKSLHSIYSHNLNWYSIVMLVVVEGGQEN